MELIDVAPFRQKMKEAIARGESTGEMCRRIGFVKTRSIPESTRLLKLAGVKKFKNSRGKKVNKEQISVENAILICRAIDIDPVEMGL